MRRLAVSDFVVTSIQVARSQISVSPRPSQIPVRPQCETGTMNETSSPAVSFRREQHDFESALH